MGVFLFIAGFVVNLVCGVIIIVKAFKVSVGWGLAVIFLPFAALFFVINHWADTKTVFLVSVGGGVLVFMGAISVANSPQMKNAIQRAEERRAASDAAQARSTESSDSSASEQPANYASAAAAPVSYNPPHNTYETPAPQPVTSYTPAYVPSYNPPAAPVATPAKTDTKQSEDFDWRPKPVYEQVYVDRATMMFYAEKCRRKPENTYRIPRTVALRQGLTEAKCQ
jgi:hypothetical protein